MKKRRIKQIGKADNDGNTALHLAAKVDANICAVSLITNGAVVSGKFNSL